MRAHAQEFIQQILKEEGSECLGRQKSQRLWQAQPVDLKRRHDHGVPAPACGTVRPVYKARGAVVKHKSMMIETLVPDLYLHGLTQGNFDLALRGLSRRVQVKSSSVAVHEKSSLDSSPGRAAEGG